MKIGVNICEDIWFSEGPTRSQALAGAEVIVNINASPYHKGKGQGTPDRCSSERAKENNVIISYTNAVGGQDELVFDGQSMVIDGKGRLIAAGRQFEEDLLIVDIKVPDRKPLVAKDTTEQHFEAIDQIVLSAKAGAEEEAAPRAKGRQGALRSAKRSTGRSCSGRGIICGRTGSRPP